MVVNRSYTKLTIRGIRGSLSRFIAIISIVALGSGFLAGLLASTPDMEKSADNYYDKSNTYDLNIKGSLGVTEEDVDSIRALGEIDEASATYSQDLMMETPDGEGYVTRIMSANFKKDDINQIKLLRGRLPEKANECVIQVINPYKVEFKNNITIKASEENEDYDKLDDTLNYKEYQVVGIVSSPLYVSVHGEISRVGDGRVELGMFVDKEAFNMDVYTDIFATLKGSKDFATYSDEYKDYVNKKTIAIKNLGIDRSEIRSNDVIGKAKKELENAKDAYNEGKQEAEQRLANAKRDIENGKEKVASGRKTLKESEAKIEKQEAELEAKEIELAKAKEGVDALKQMRDAGYPLSEEQLEQIAAYDEAVATISSGKQEIAAAKTKIKNSEAKLDKSAAAIKRGEAEYNSEKQKAEEELANAKKEIDEAAKEIANIDEAKWYIQSREDNIGISGFKSDSEKVAAVAKVFPIFFFVIALLVALTTLTRMVEEQRMQTGTLKSLGYSNREILNYYMIYSLSATVIGCAIGLVLGFAAFPKVISNAYVMMYTLPTVKMELLPYIAIPIVLVITVCILAAAYFSCRNELREKPAQLLLPRAPKPGKRILLERITPLWSCLKFTQKVTLRNLFRYKKHFLMTIIGIAGCFALLITGFGIRDSINDIVNKQYDEIYKYDFTVELTDELTNNAELNVINDKNLVKRYMSVSESPVKLKYKGNTQESTICVPSASKEFTEYVSLRQRVSGEKYIFADDSVILTEKTAEELGASIGDSIKVVLENGREAKFELDGISENYVSSYIYIGRDAYEEAFEQPCKYKTILLVANINKNVSSYRVSSALLESDRVSYALSSESIRQSFGDSVKSIDYVVYVVIFSAIALAVIVLYNLCNVNICERKKELATLKVLGFYEKEAVNYVFRETNILCVIGMIIGVPLGILLHKFVILTVEVGGVMFGREIYWQSYVYAVIITLVSIFVVNLIMRRSIRNIDMVESMKAND